MTFTFTAALAQQVINVCTARAAELGVAVSVAVVDEHCRDLLIVRGEGAPWMSCGIAASKAKTAVAFGMPTEQFAELRERSPEVVKLVEGQLSFAPTGLNGGRVIRSADSVVLGVGISGASGAQDADIADVIQGLLTAALNESDSVNDSAGDGQSR